MAREDGEQQAMTAERLAEIESRVIEASYPRYDYPYSTDAKRDMSDLLAEVERLRARVAALVAAVDFVLSLETADQRGDEPDSSWWEMSYKELRQARALLASADESERSGGDGA